MGSFIINPQLKIRPSDDSTFKTDDLVKVPFRVDQYMVENVGSSASYNYSGITSNEDGSDTGINVSVPTGLGNGVRIRFPFYGRVLGIRWRRNISACDFSVAVDGVPYGQISAKHNYLINEGASTLVDGESLVIVASDLEDGTHYAEIVVTNGAATNVILFYGFLAERRAGYSEKPRTSVISLTATLPTAAASVSLGTSPNILRSVRKILYMNTTAAVITVTLLNNTTPIWQKPVPANDTVEIDFGDGVSVNTLIKHQASATGVNVTVIGGY